MLLSYIYFFLSNNHTHIRPRMLAATSLSHCTFNSDYATLGPCLFSVQIQWIFLSHHSVILHQHLTLILSIPFFFVLNFTEFLLSSIFLDMLLMDPLHPLCTLANILSLPQIKHCLTWIWPSSHPAAEILHIVQDLQSASSTPQTLCFNQKLVLSPSSHSAYFSPSDLLLHKIMAFFKEAGKL